MPEIVTIDIIENNEGGHKDLLFSIPDLFEEKTFDSYYFYIAVEPVETINNLKSAVSILIKFWIDKVSEINNEETIFLPIDFSDQYTGCLQVQMIDEQLVLTYGYSEQEGHSLDPLNPENFYKNVNDFKANPLKQLTINQHLFISALEVQLKKMKSKITE